MTYDERFKTENAEALKEARAEQRDIHRKKQKEHGRCWCMFNRVGCFKGWERHECVPPAAGGIIFCGRRTNP